jgi:hypothetical protein
MGMKLEVLTDIVTDALIVSGRSDILKSILKDSSADNIERQARCLPNGSPLQLGLMHYGDVLRVASVCKAFGQQPQGRAYEMHKAVDCLKQIPGVSVSDEEYWGIGERKPRPLPTKPEAKKTEFPTRNEGEDLFDWLCRCPLWYWVNFDLKRDIPHYQKRNPVWWAAKKETAMHPGSSLKVRRIIGSADNYEGGKYVKITPEVLNQAVAAGLMVLAPDKQYNEYIDTYVLAEQYRIK